MSTATLTPINLATVADFRRAAIVGSVWHCDNHRHPHTSGARVITHAGPSVLRFRGVRADGSTFDNGRQEIPKVAEVRLDGPSITWLDHAGSPDYTWRYVPVAGLPAGPTTDVAWTRVRQVVVADLVPGDTCVVPSAGTGYRVAVDGTVAGFRWMPLDGRLWTVLAVDGPTITVYAGGGHVVTETPAATATVLRLTGGF